MIDYSEKDIDRGLAIQAFGGTSWTPEKRGEDRIAEYMGHMAGLAEEFAAFVSPQNEAQMRRDLEDYRRRYLVPWISGAVHLKNFLSAVQHTP